MAKKGTIIFIKDGKLKTVYAHRNAELPKLGKSLVSLINEKGAAGLAEIYDRLTEANDEEPMTKEQAEAYRKYIPEKLWKEDLSWNEALGYTLDATRPLRDGFRYYVDYSSFIPAWRNRYRYAVDLDRGVLQIAKGGLEIIAAATDEIDHSLGYPGRMATCVLAVYPFNAIPEDWLEQCEAKWKSLQLKAVPFDGLAEEGRRNESDAELQKDAAAMKYFIGVEGY